MSRSQFLRMGGAAAAGAVAAGASGLLSARPAAATTGNPLAIGATNAPTSPDDATTLSNPSTSQLSALLLRMDNTTSVPVSLPLARIAMAGTTNGPDTVAQPKVGLWGQTDDASHYGAGVVGRGGTTGAEPIAFGGECKGVIGTASDNGVGVGGASNGPLGYGVVGYSDAGYGVVGSSETGISVDVRSGGRLRQALRGTTGPPTAGGFFAGEQIRDRDGQLWLCVVTGTPGTWRRGATVKEGFQGGSVNVLTKPVRIFDSRTGAPLAPGASVDVQVTGVVVGEVSVPAGAVALLGNVAVTQTVGPNGYLILYPQASPPEPSHRQHQPVRAQPGSQHVGGGGPQPRQRQAHHPQRHRGRLGAHARGPRRRRLCDLTQGPRRARRQG